MKFLIITHVPHIKKNDSYSAYAPYVKEMNIWIKYATAVEIVAPQSNKQETPIDLDYVHSNLKFSAIKGFDLVGISNKLKAVMTIPLIIISIFKAMKRADHIHLRCPGNVGLLGCLVQIVFPKKMKTAKYAGNWDPKARQPISYKLQRWILSNTFLTKNMQVLVYGDWPNQTKNIKSFFTATYSEAEKETILRRNFDDPIQLLFVGTLSEGKRLSYAVKIVNELTKQGFLVKLRIFGEGPLREEIENYCRQERLDSIIILEGNQKKEIVQEAYQKSHFLILPSKSEGWPKVVAEAMFWGCVPLCTPVSCVPTMLDHENRGFFLKLNLKNDSKKIVDQIENPSEYQRLSDNASSWSRQFTTDYFESEIQKLLKI